MFDMKSMKWNVTYSGTSNDFNEHNPGGRWHSCAWFYNDSLYIFGGIGNSTDQHDSDTLYQFLPNGTLYVDSTSTTGAATRLY
jgi:hypothetical protein